MIQFKNIDDLRNFLRKDKETVSLCPLRFINVDSMEMWIKVKKLLLSMSKKHICLSNFCSLDDTTPNMYRFNSCIRALSENACISPLSEYLRINPDIAQDTIKSLLSKNYSGNSSGKLRIYIPMYRMKSILQNINDSDPRKKDSILLLNTGEESDYSLTVIQKELKINISGNEIFGFKNYLQYWEQNPDKPIILHTENAIHFENRIFFDNVRVIVSAFDLLTAYFHLPSAFDEADGTSEYWNRLAIAAAEEMSFEDACCHELLINRYTTKLFEKWPSLDSFQRWLLWLWTKAKNITGYLGKCIYRSSTVKEFKELIYKTILDSFSSNSYDKYYYERRELIRKMGLSVPGSFWNEIEGLKPLDKLKVLTDLSDKERKTVFNILKDVKETERTKAIEILQLTYPALAEYLNSSEDNSADGLTEDMAAYFEQYRWNKAANILPKTFIEKVEAFAVQKGASVYELMPRNLIVSEEYDANTAIIFSDGLGVEYVNYLYFVLNQLKEEGYNVKARIGYCNLPSTTEANKDFLVGRRVVEELTEPDEMKHGKTAYPQSIENELNFLNCFKEKIRSAFTADISRIILTTDHGTSRMAVLVRKTEFDCKIPPEGHAIYKYGRYCEGTDMADKIPTAIEYDNKLIFADYRRFDQKGSPIDETHGGASLEEWLVPVFIIDNTAVRKETVKIKIIVTADSLRPDAMTKMVTVSFSLENYLAGNVSVRIHGKKIVCRCMQSHYEFKYKPEKNENSVSANVYVNSDNIGDFKFTIKQGISKNSIFDLL